MLEINVCDSMESFLHLEAEWNELQSRQKDFNIFVSFPWVSAWFKHLAGDALPLIVTGRENGKLSCIAPFAVKSRMIIPAGYPESDFIDLICNDSEAENFLSEALKYIAGDDSSSPNWNIAYIKAIAESSGLYRWFSSCALPGELGSSLSFLSKCYVADISSGWDSYYNSLSAKVRTNLRRGEKLASGYGDVAIGIYRGGEITEQVVMDIASINLKGRKASKKTAFFQKQEHVDFFRELAKSSLARRNMLAAFLKIAGENAGYKLCFLNGNDVWEYNTAFDEKFSKCSPGKILTLYLMKELAEKGFRSYDFLKGDEAYKKEFASASYRLFVLSFFKKTLSSRTCHFVMVRLREKLRRIKFLADIYDRFAG